MIDARVRSESGGGYAAGLNARGREMTKAFPPARTVYATPGMADTISTEVLPARAGRTGLVIQVKGANAVYFRFAESAASILDLQVAPGGMFEFPAGNTYEGPIRAIAPGGPTDILLLEFAE